MSGYRFVDAEKAGFPIALLCRVLGVSRSGFYAWAGRAASARARADAALTEQIRTVHATHRGTYGAPRVHAHLRHAGTRCGRKRVARLMRAVGLSGRRRSAQRPRTTVADPTRVPAPNVLARAFAAPTPDRVWVGDITYVATGEGWLYLAVLLDVCSRRVVGWAMGDHLRTDLTLEALAAALGRRAPAPGLVHHTDRGCQYTAAPYRARLARAGIVPSMSRPGDCYDNALAESFFATLKGELVDRRPWPTRWAARQAIFEWLEVFYNRQRLHSALGYLSPVAFEERMVPMPLAA